MLPRYCLSALAAAAAVCCPLEAAYACGVLPCAGLSDIQPRDGSVGVPRNTELRALYFGTLEYVDAEADRYQTIDLTPMRLVPDGGEPLLLTATVLERPETQQAWAIGQHVEPLAANTTYELQLPDAERDICVGDAPEWKTVSTFTTGSDEDHAAPSFAGIDHINYGERLTGSSTCGISDIIPVLPQFVPATDDAPDIRYNIYAGGRLVQRHVELAGSTQVVPAVVDCGSTALATYGRVLSGDGLELRAVDLAGNESASTAPIAIEATCAALPGETPAMTPPSTVRPPDDPDPTTVETAIDSNGQDPTGATSSERASMAGCAVVREPGPVPLVALAALLSLLGRRCGAARRSCRF